MALHWLWSEKVGEADIQQNGIEFTCSLYQGNAYLIFIYEYEEEGQDLYQMHSFILDKDHLKNMLGLNAKDGFSINEFDRDSERLVAVRFIKKKLRYSKEIISSLVQAFDRITIQLVDDLPDDEDEIEEYPDTDYDNC